MLFKKKETILNVKDGLGRIIAIINKRSFKYVFFNKANKKIKFAFVLKVIILSTLKSIQRNKQLKL